MKAFGDLILALDATTKTNEKLGILTRFLERSDEKDKLWLVALLTGRRPKRIVKTGLLREWAAEAADLPLWLLEESYHVVGDLAETLALILPENKKAGHRALGIRMEELMDLRGKDDGAIKAYVMDAWASMSKSERFVFNKLMTGGFRIGVSQKLITRALSRHLNEDENTLAHRLMGDWNPRHTTFTDLLIEPDPNEDLSKPFPFYLAYPLESEPADLGDPEDWQFEYKWDGIRGQLIARQGEVFVWSRGEELVTERFPELGEVGEKLNRDCVIDGEIMAFKDGKPLTFNHLQTRIGRKRLSKKILKESPAVMMAYDLLELDGSDLRQKSLSERRALLKDLFAKAELPALKLSEELKVSDWTDAARLRENSRDALAEGLMVKRRDSAYGVGRKRGDWWKWKVDPMSVDAVMIYAMRGHGRRANLYTDYTFAVWKQGELIPFAKAYSGLTDKEIQEVDRFVKKNTLERFGPVRSVKPELVFEIGFEGIAPSNRHKSGIALRFPRILRRRPDKPAEDANTLEDLQKLLEAYR